MDRLWTASLRDETTGSGYANMTEELTDLITKEEWDSTTGRWKDIIGPFQEQKSFGLQTYEPQRTGQPSHTRRTVDSRIVGEKGIICVRSWLVESNGSWLLNGFEIV